MVDPGTDTVVGWADGFRNGRVVGWAWRPDKPSATVEVEIFADGAPVARATACIERADLRSAGIGTGRHAFSVPLDLDPCSDRPTEILVRVVGGPELNNGRFVISARSGLADSEEDTAALVASVFGLGPGSAAPVCPEPPKSALCSFILWSSAGQGDMQDRLGAPEYSYDLVMRAYRVVLRRFGVVHVAGPGTEAIDRIAAQCAARGENCLLLAFAPPHLLPLGLRVSPTPVFAWEFATLPTQVWDGNMRHDWRYGLRQAGRAITHCSFTVKTVQDAMGVFYPVVSIPAPIWNRMAHLRCRLGQTPPAGGSRLSIEGFVIDTLSMTFDVEGLPPALPPAAAPHQSVRLPTRPDVTSLAYVRHSLPNGAGVGDHALGGGDLGEATMAMPDQDAPGPDVSKRLPASAHPEAGIKQAIHVYRYRQDMEAELAVPPLEEPCLATSSQYPEERLAPRCNVPAEVTVDGIVFTAVLAPRDGRKNWPDILTAFLAAFGKTPDATLVFKMIGPDPAFWWWEFNDIMSRYGAVACRVIVLQGFLDQARYEALIAASHWAVNASLGEGQCLPLMEFMSAGRPAIAPAHSAMADYISQDNAMIVGSDPEYCAWPHDTRNLLTTERHRIDWVSLRDAMMDAYRISRYDISKYRAMAGAAIESSRLFCSDDVVASRLAAFLGLDRPAAQPGGMVGKVA